MKLRDYQQSALDIIWNDMRRMSSILYQASTGAGKTEVIIALLQKALAAKIEFKAVVLAQRTNLVKQTYDRIIKTIDQKNVGVYCSTLSRWECNKPIVIGSIQSLSGFDFGKIHLCILDETHNADNEEGRYFEFLKLHQEQNKNLKVIGFTATPYRADGFIYGEGKLFPELNAKTDMEFLIEKGYLVPPRLKKTDHQFDTSKLKVVLGEYAASDIEKQMTSSFVMSQITDAIPRLDGRKKIIWACLNIAHAEMVNEDLRRMGEGSVILHSQMRTEERDNSTRAFEKGNARHLVFIDVCSEGWDYPPVDACVLMRPIRSPGRYVQIVGRTLRPFDGKKDALILDYGKVVETLGPVNNPVIEVKGKGSNQEPGEPVMKFCIKCFEYIPAACTLCPACGHAMPREAKLTKEAEQNANILAENKVYTERFEYMDIQPHESKAKNQCTRITFKSTSILDPYGLNFYFVNGNYYAEKELNFIRGLLPWSYSNLIIGRVNLKGQVSYKKEQGRYNKIVDIKFDEKEHNAEI